MQTTIIIILFITAYLLGSIPGGYLITKLVKKEDIRNYGSKSTGATNATRVLGFKLGLVAALIDVFKGVILLLILTLFNLKQFYIINNINILAYFGLASVIGHIYPIFLNFNGGKAVATSFGVVMFLNPLIAIIGVLVFIVVAKLTNYVSVSSMVAATSIFLLSLFSYIFKIKYLNFRPLNKETIIAYLLFVLIIIYRHKSNIVRLFNGNENKISDLKR